MNFIDEIVGTQYVDYKGKIEIDTHGGSDLFQLSEDYGLDTGKYFPIAFGFGENTILGIGMTREVRFIIYSIPKEIAGNTFDEIQDFIERNHGKVTVEKFAFNISYSEFFKYFKRFDLFAINSLGNIIEDFEIKEKEFHY